MQEIIVEFDTRFGTSNFGKVVFFYDDDLLTDGDVIDVELTDPTGFVVVPFGTITATVPSGGPSTLVQFGTANIARSGFNFVSGNYVLKYEKNNIEVGNSVFCYKPSNNFVNESKAADFKAEVDCGTASIRFTDSTVNTGWTVASRTISVQPPTIPPSAAPAAQTTSNASLNLTFSYTNVTYIGTLSIVRSKETDPVDVVQFIQRESIGAVVNKFVDCGTGICDVYGCIKGYYEKLSSKVCTLGGWNRLPATDASTLLRITNLATLYTSSSTCGDAGNAERYRKEIEEVLGSCGCDCKSSESDGLPRPYNISGSVSQSVVDGVLTDIQTIQGQIASLQSSIGLVNDLGSFTGITIPDNQTVKQALQSLETALESLNVGLQYFEEGQVLNQYVEWKVKATNNNTSLILLHKPSGALSLNTSSQRGVNSVNLSSNGGASDGAIGVSSIVLGRQGTAYGSYSEARGDNGRAMYSAESGFGWAGGFQQQRVIRFDRATAAQDIEVLATEAFLSEGFIRPQVAYVGSSVVSVSGVWACELDLLVTNLISLSPFTRGDDSYYTKIYFIYRFKSSTPSIIGTPDVVTEVYSANMSTTTVAISANTANESLKILVTPPPADTGFAIFKLAGTLKMIELNNLP